MKDDVWYVQIPFGAGNVLVVCRSIVYQNHRVREKEVLEFKGMAYCEKVLAIYIPEGVQRGGKFTDEQNFLLIDWQIVAKRMQKRKALALFVSERL